jgi:hypothetical protein
MIDNFFYQIRMVKWTDCNQSLVDSVVIDAELIKEDHNSIPRNCDREGMEVLDVRTYPQTRLNWW